MKDIAKTVAVALLVVAVLVMWVAWSALTAPSCGEATRNDLICTGDR